MIRNNFARLRFFFLGLLLINVVQGKADARPALPSGPVQTYFLVVASEDYAANDWRYPFPLARIFAPEHSARRVSAALVDLGARYGIVLTSDRANAPGRRMVTRTDILTALSALKQRIRGDHSANPRIIFYFIGHGLGDRPSGFLYMTPGDLVFDEKTSQTYTLRLIKRFLTDFDIVSALVTFRVHPSMKHFDNFVPSSTILDPTSPTDMENVRKFTEALAAADEENRRSGTYPPEGNAPVPYVALFDNCYGGVVEDLVNRNRLTWFERKFVDEMAQSMKDLQSDGLVLYAAKPGEAAIDFPDPDHASEEAAPVLGALAYRLVSFAASRRTSQPVTMREFRESMTGPLPAGSAPVPPPPFHLDATIDEILDAPILPGRIENPKGEIEVRTGTGQTVVKCCDE